MVVIVWQLDLQLPMQSVPITTQGTDVVRSNPPSGDVYKIQYYVIKFVSDLRGKSVVFSTNKTDRHVITEILLKVALSTIHLTKPTSLTIQQKFILYFVHRYQNTVRVQYFNHIYTRYNLIIIKFNFNKILPFKSNMQLAMNTIPFHNTIYNNNTITS